MAHPHNLMDITQPEAEALLRRTRTVVIPTGSVEQHGPHLPCGTDTYVATAIGEGVAQGLDALLVPFAPMGVTPLHMGFAGSITLRPGTFVRIMRDIAGSLSRHGAERFVILNWHEGNIPSIGVAASEIHHTLKVQTVVVQACYVADELFGVECGGLTHGGELEALPLLMYAPGLLRLERATNPSPAPQGSTIDAVRRRRSVAPILSDIRQIAPTGWYGSPQRATPERARRMMHGVVDRIVADVRAAWKALSEQKGG